ncbi:RsfA family transcriptional regulator [Fictibacillus sp. KU28468]|uniref:RsfA family transcriptional regulator n=1 Tax=Fictibacillus sp. KU28468 TaxID=2991053 RepID=UPI00223CBDE0|nr:RsfA family transcriptional regulator [Fictibacillus sp. KU28468]UZJ77267.1 RsfA family transcriptional regulator [Fictibacillus sp. KU28468]
MTVVRQDAWNQEEDVLLADVVLRHIREGSTQLAAFEEVGEKLSRTSAACGFRWNSLIRKRYESAIAIAKKQRKERNKDKIDYEESRVDVSRHAGKRDEYVVAKEKSLSLDDVIVFLKNFKSTEERRSGQELANLRNQVEELKTQNAQFQSHIQKLNHEYQLVCEDYKALIEIMDRARKMVATDEEGGNHLTFKVDGLQKLEK